MKKQYISPALLIVRVNHQSIIAASTLVDKYDTSASTTEDSYGSAALVKGNNYNVWSDDWSN